jgi:hypothetical protein
LDVYASLDRGEAKRLCLRAEAENRNLYDVFRDEGLLPADLDRYGLSPDD